MAPWEFPQDLFIGKTVAVLGTGPSLTQEAVERAFAAADIVIAVNDAYRMAPAAHYLLGADERWWLCHPEAMQLPAVKISCQGNHINAKRFFNSPDNRGFGRNSACHAAIFAIVAGAQRVLLFGVDLVDDQPTHFFGSHPRELRPIRNNDFKDAREAWTRMRQTYPKADVVNMNPESAVRDFPFEFSP